MAQGVLPAQVVPHNDPEAWALAQEAFRIAPVGSTGIKGNFRNMGHFLLHKEWGQAEQLCNRHLALVETSPKLSCLFYRYLAFVLQRQNKLVEMEIADKKASALSTQLRASASANSSAPAANPAQLNDSGIDDAVGPLRYFIQTKDGRLIARTLARRNEFVILPIAAASSAQSSASSAVSSASASATLSDAAEGLAQLSGR